MGEIKVRLLLSKRAIFLISLYGHKCFPAKPFPFSDSKEYLESISQLFNTKKMTLDAIVKLHPENDYQRRSTNKKEESFHAANANPDIAENPEERNYDKDVKDDDDEAEDNKKVASKPVTKDQNQKLLPINQRSTVRKRQAPCRLSLEVSQTNDYEDLITSKKAKTTSKEKRENMSVAHKTAFDRILSQVIDLHS